MTPEELAQQMDRKTAAAIVTAGIASILTSFVAVASALWANRSTVLDAIGAALVVAGVAMWSVPAAFVVAGIAVLLIAHPITIRRSR